VEPEAKFMKEALRLARRGLGRTRPNPAVGAVIVKGGRIVGRGWHRKCGEPHAEAMALRDAGRRARGADLYVTLEPCGHWGRTPPCAAGAVSAGIKRVFYGCRDPNPLTAGKGLRILRRAGVLAVEGPLAEEARYLNEPYLKWVTTKIPLVTAKWAMTVDGKIATRTFHSRWITGEKAREEAHRLRNEVDAVLVGTETVLKDDPLLTCRIRGGRTPIRILLDRRGRIPLSSAVFTTIEEGPVVVYTARMKDSRVKTLRKRGVEVHRVRATGRGLSLTAVLRDLGKMGVHHLLVEGGGAVLGAFFDSRLVDRAVVFLAPKVIGGEEAVGPVRGKGVAVTADALGGAIRRIRRLGDDLILEIDMAGDENRAD